MMNTEDYQRRTEERLARIEQLQANYLAARVALNLIARKVELSEEAAPQEIVEAVEALKEDRNTWKDRAEYAADTLQTNVILRSTETNHLYGVLYDIRRALQANDWEQVKDIIAGEIRAKEHRDREADRQMNERLEREQAEKET